MRIIKIIVTSSLLTLNFNVFAQTIDTVKTQSLKEVIVIGAKDNLLYNNQLTTNQNLSKSEVSALRPEKLKDGLSLFPSLFLAPDGIGGQTITLRGYQQNQINIFYNGIPIRSNTEGSISMDGFFMSNADLTVEKGASSLIYASNSSGNVIRMENKLFFDEKIGITAGTFFGNNGKQNYNLSIHGKITDKISYQLSGNYYKRNSFVLSSKFNVIPDQPTTKERVNSDQENWETMATITYAPNKNHYFSLFGMYNNSEFGYTPSIDRARFRRMDSWQNTVLGLRSVSNFQKNLRLETNFYYTHLIDTLNQYTNKSFSTVRSVSFWNDQTLGTRVILSKDINKYHTFNVSADYKNDIHRQVWFKNAETKANTFIGAFEYKANLYKNLYLTSGISYNSTNPTYSSINSNLARKDLSAFNYQISTAYLLNNISKIHIGYSRNTIFPRIRDLFGDALLPYIPNPNLKVEKSDNFDIGYTTKLMDNKLNFTTSFYYSAIQDLLTQIKITDTTSQVINLQSAQYLGGELMVKYKPNKKIFGLMCYNYLKATNTSDNRTSDYIAYRPEHNLRLFGSYIPTKYFGIDVTYNYVSKRFYDNITSWKDVPNYSLVDIGIQSKPIDNITLWFKINNVFDENYFIAFDQPQAGREFRIGLNVEWNKK